MLLQTDEKLGKLGMSFPNFIEEVPRLKIALRNKAQALNLQLDHLELQLEYRQHITNSFYKIRTGIIVRWYRCHT